MTSAVSRDSRYVTAERNLEAILDAAQGLLQRGEQINVSAVATAAGVSRPTVYSHFPNPDQLLKALVERTVQRTMAAIESAEPESGPPLDALQRLIAASWEELAHHEEIARAASTHLNAHAMRRAHESARGVIRKLVERGRRGHSFRTDLPIEWLVTTCLALIHAAADEVRMGELDPSAAHTALYRTIADLLVGPASRAKRQSLRGRIPRRR